MRGRHHEGGFHTGNAEIVLGVSERRRAAG